jgi:hypothetical protein
MYVDIENENLFTLTLEADGFRYRIDGNQPASKVNRLWFICRGSCRGRGEKANDQSNEGRLRHSSFHLDGLAFFVSLRQARIRRSSSRGQTTCKSPIERFSPRLFRSAQLPERS